MPSLHWRTFAFSYFRWVQYHNHRLRTMRQKYGASRLYGWAIFLLTAKMREARPFCDNNPQSNGTYLARFMPSPLSTGSLHLSFPSHPPPHSHLPLSLLRPSHFPLAVIGVAACSHTETLSSTFSQFNASLLDIFPSGAIFPLARTCFVFEESDGNTTLDLTECPPGLVVLPSMMGNKKIYIGTLLADLCSQILGEVGVLVS